MDPLIFRFLQGQATRAEEAELDAWREDWPENEKRFREVQRVWQLTGIWNWRSATTDPPTADDLLGNRRIPVGTATQRSMPWLAAAAILVLLSSVGILSSVLRGPTDIPVSEFVTGPGEMATAQLEDGTVVRLASSSRLRVTSMKRERNVSLDGKAFFAVAKDPKRPFTVQTRAGQATVLGTQFELTAYGEDLHLVVVEGSVALSAAGRTVAVEAGEASQIVDETGPGPVRVSDVEEETEWLGDFVVFQATPLHEVAETIEKRFGTRIVVEDTEMAERTVTAWFSSEGVDEIMRVVCRVVDARCRLNGDTVRVEY